MCPCRECMAELESLRDALREAERQRDDWRETAGRELSEKLSAIAEEGGRAWTLEELQESHAQWIASLQAEGRDPATFYAPDFIDWLGATHG